MQSGPGDSRTCDPIVSDSQTMRRRRRNLRERFIEKIGPGDLHTCWRWQSGHIPGGYGVITIGVGKIQLAHRVAYELFIGPIPAGLTLDHVAARGCTYRDCVNPLHLEPVSSRENTLRGN